MTNLAFKSELATHFRLTNIRGRDGSNLRVWLVIRKSHLHFAVAGVQEPTESGGAPRGQQLAQIRAAKKNIFSTSHIDRINKTLTRTIGFCI